MGRGVVRGWLSEVAGVPGWALVVAGRVVGGDAARPGREQGEGLEGVLGGPPSGSGAWAGFWDVPDPLGASCG